MPDINWASSVELWRVANGMAIVPDEPIWANPAKIGTGSLAAMVRQFRKLPYSHQRYHELRNTDGSTLYDSDQVRQLAVRADLP